MSVFISYSSKNHSVAHLVCDKLENDGIKCWIAPRDIEPGSPYGCAIINALNSTDLVVLIFSRHSNKSPQVEREIERAVSKRIPVIPFRIENATLSQSMEYFISVSHWLDAEHGELEPHICKLSDCIAKRLRKD